MMCVVGLACGVSGAAQPTQAKDVMARITPHSVKSHVSRLASFGTRHTLSETESDTTGIGAARRWIRDEFERFKRKSGGRLEVQMERFEQPPMRRIPEPVELVNVIAVLPGSMPEAAHRRYYVIGHYDSRASDGMDAESDAPGANDDGSGTAVVIELARVMADQELDATVVFMTNPGEEQGLLGASYHAAQAVANEWTIGGVLSNDIVGNPNGPPFADGTPRRADDLIRLFSEGVPRNPDAQQIGRIRALSGESDSASRQLARYVAEVAEWEGTDVKPMLVFRPDRFLRGGDHTPFNNEGFAAVRFTEVYEDYTKQHQDVRIEDGVTYGDLPRDVDAQYLAGVAKLNAAALVHLANAPSVPGNARIIIAELTNDTTIRWDASPEPDVAGYEIVWRETTSPVWEHVRDVGNVTEATIDLSKDNWFFGVRAYDRDGYKSPVAFPGAARE